MMSLTRKRKLGSPERLQIGSKASKQEEWMSPPTSHNAPQSKPQVTPPCTPEKSQVCPTLLEPMAKGKDQGVVPETLSPRRQSPRSKGQSQTPHKDPKTTVSSEDPTQCHSPTEHPSPAEEDTELDLVITLDEQEGGGRRGRRKAAVKRKRGAGGEGVPPDCEFEVDGQLDRELESKSKQHNLTTVNVRNIIHEVITNEHVVAMMKAAISETQDMPMFEPKMTRSKLKEVVEKGVVIPTWNISPIKKAKEPPQFVDIPLDEEDSSDEEYCPDEDEEDETAEETFLESDVESTASSPRGSRLGRPRTPLDTSEGDEERSSSPTQGLSPPGPNQQRHLRVEVVPMGPPPPPKAPGGPSWPQQPDFSFMEKLHAVEEELEQSPVCMDSYQSLGDSLVACRTRSKRPLKDVPLGLLEAELRAPDITPDMYEMGGQEDNEWQGWLRGLMTSEVENDEEGDDEDDPEYNFLDDIDEPDLEDYRNDRAVRITKKEVNELMEELFETFQDELGVPDQDDEGHDDEEEREEEVEQGTPKFNVPQAIRFEEPLANMLTERRRTVKEQLEALQQRRALQESRPEPPAPAPAGPHFLMLPSPTCTLLLNPTQKHQLQQQMQQHVQLLTQVHMLTSTIPVLQSEAVTTRHFLTELQSFAQSTEETRGLVEPGFVSMFRACNLEGALSLLEEFDRTIKPQLTQASPQRPARQRCNTVVRPYPTMPPRLAWLLATRKEFLCPELLPICSLDPAQHPPRVKTIYTRGEDSLIALGLKHFADTEFPHQLVCRYLVRTKTAQQLRMHLREASHCRAPDNELKHFLLTRKVPPLLRACQGVLPTDSRPAVERELARMPAWLQKSLPIIHKAVLDYNSTLEGGEATPGESTPPYVFPPGTQYPPDLPADVTLRLNPYGVRTLKPHSRLWPHGRAKRLALSRPVVLPLDKTPMVLQMPLSTRPVNFNPTVTLTRISEKELEQNACKKASSSISKICPFLIPTLLPPVSSPCSAGGVMTGTAVAVQTPSTTVRLSVAPPCSAGGVKTGTVIAPQKPSTTVQLSVGAPCSAGGVITGTAVAAQTPLCTVQIPVSVPYKAKRAKKGAAVALQTSSTTLRFPVGASYGTGGVMTGMEGGAQTPSCTVQIPVSAPCQAGGAGTGMSVASATPGITVQLRAAPPVSFSRAMVAAGVNPSSQFLQIRPVSRSPSQLQAPLQPLLLTIPTGGSVSLYSLGGASVGGVGNGGAGGMLFPRAVGETGPRRVCRVLQPTVVIKLGTPLTTAVTAADKTSAETPPEPASQPQDPVTHPDGALAVLRKLVGVAPESGRSPTLKGDIPLQLRTSPFLQCSIPSPESRHPVSINPTSLPSPVAPETSPGNLGTNTSEVEGAPQLSSKPPDVMGQERAGAMQDPHSCQVAIHIPVSTSAGGPPECMDSQSLESSTLTHAEMAAPLKSAAPQCPEPQQPTAGTTEEMNPTGAVPHLSTNTADDTETSQKVWISTDTGAAQPLSQELQGCTVKSVPQNFSSIMDTKGTPQYSTVNAENKGVLPTPSSDIGTKEAPPGNSNTIFNKGTPTNSSELISTFGVRSETGDRGQGQTETPESQTFTSHNVGSCEGSGGVPQESSEAKDTTGSSCRVSGMHPSPFLCTPLGACLPEGEIEEVEEDREDLGQEEEHEEEMGSDFGEPLLALSESSGSPASSLDSQADALERLMEIEGEEEGRGNEEEREGGNLTCRDSVPQLQRGTEEEEEGGRGREEEMERGGLTCRDIVPQVERGTEKEEEEEKGGRGSEEERERGGSTSRDGVPQLERGNTEGGGSSPQLERNEEERETEKERGASVCRDSVLSLRRDTEGEEEGGRTVSGHGSPQLENNEEEDGGGRPGPRRSETEGEEGERTGQEEDRARVNTTACQVEWGLQGEAGGGGLALSSGTESQGQPGQAGEGGGGGGGGGGGEQEGQRGGGADQVGEGASGGEGERDGGEGEKRGEGEGGEDESEKGDGDGERQGEGEEEEDFDDLTQDEDEEEVMSSASEESVLSVPELQETMEKLTWLASERRMCPEGDSEEDNSQNSQNSQEENSEEEEEGGPRKGEEAGEGDARKMIGQGAPQGAGPLETSDKCAGRGRGRGRTPSRSLRRSRRRERDSKDTSKLLLLYDDNILENDPMRESKDIAFAQAYLNRVREALQGYPGKVEEFLGVLYEFERGREQRSAVELFSQLRAVLTDWPDLLRDFAAFLLPEQALECGLFAEQQAFERSRRFLRQLEICFGENSSQYQKIVKALQVGPELSPAGVEELKVQMASLLKGHSHLEGEFWVFFDELRPPPSRPGQFEEAAWPEEGEGCAEGGFEEVTLPDLEEEEESHKIPPITGRGKRRKEMGSHGNEKECDWPEAAKDCPCPCHDSAHDAKLRRHKRKGCPHCHVAKGSSDSSRPSRNREPSEPGASSPGRASAEGRLGGGEEEGEGNSPPAGTALRSHTAGASDQQTSRSPTSVLLRSVSGPAGSGVRPWDCGEGGAPREEAEEGEAERDKDSGGGSPSPKKSRTDAGAAVATETEAWEEGGCRDPQGAPRAPLPCCSAPPHTQGEPLGGQSPSLSSTPLRMSSGSDSTVCAKNISLTPSGEKVILWNREADRVILTTCQQQGASQATFQAISAQLGNKTTSEVSRRFRDLMRLFHTAARQLSSEDEASAAEQQSATDEELD